jgi:DNA invertase Pin-like site-specific DNA recombinase
MKKNHNKTLSIGPIRVALYTRISPGGGIRSEEGSLETQAARLKRMVEFRSENEVEFRGQRGIRAHHVVALFREEDRSGKNMDRPELRRLIQLVEDDAIDLVMVTRVDRLSRSLLDFTSLHALFEKHDVMFVSLNENFDTSTGTGKAMLQLVLVFAELERSQTAERTQVALQARAERGLWNGGAPILGYDSEGDGKLAVNEAEAAVVRAAYAQMIELRSARNVARWLNEQGHRQKQYESRRKGMKAEREFTPPVVVNMLKNRRYLGEVCNAGQWYPGNQDAIIDADTFERVQEILAANIRRGRPSSPASKHFYLLSGKLRCGHCKTYALTTSGSRGRNGVLYPYYRCVSFPKKAETNCTVRQVRAERIEGAVLGVVREAARHPELVAQAIAETERIVREEMVPARDRLDALRGERAAVKRELDQGFSMMTSGPVEGVRYFADKMQELDQRFQQLDSAIIDEEVRLSEVEGRQLNLDLAVQALRGFDTVFEYLTLEERKEFLDLMIDEVVVHPDRIEVALYEGSQASVVAEKIDAKTKGRRKAATVKGKGKRPRGKADAADVSVVAPGAEAQNDDTPGHSFTDAQGCVWWIDWLP